MWSTLAPVHSAIDCWLTNWTHFCLTFLKYIWRHSHPRQSCAERECNLSQFGLGTSFQSDDTPSDLFLFRTSHWRRCTMCCRPNPCSTRWALEISACVYESKDVQELFSVTDFSPCSPQLTTYTTLMQVSEGKLESYIRDCPSPCMPW